MTTNYYQRQHEYYFNNYDYKIIINNCKELCNNKILKECLFYLIDTIKPLLDTNNLELLYNINYHSILWEYLNKECIGMTNGIFQEFKSILFKDITQWSYNKLNDLMHFNGLMSYILIIVNKYNK